MFNEVVNEGIDQACICDPKRCMVITKNIIFIHGHSHANQQYFFWKAFLLRNRVNDLEMAH